MTHALDKITTNSVELSVEQQHQPAPLCESVDMALKDYFKQLDGQPPSDLYNILLAQVEAPLFKATLEYTNGNQSRAADILGINRGTLRKKLKTYDL
jgi:Fis family transcriptional regulator